MPLLAKVIGGVICVFGFAVALRPEWMKRMLAFWKEGKRLYYVGVIRITAGLVFLSAAFGSRVPGAAVALGILFLLSGVLVFLLGPERLRPLIEWWDKRSAIVCRLAGALVTAFGMLILCVI